MVGEMALASPIARSRGTALLSALVLCFTGCPGSATRGPDGAPQTKTQEALETTEPVYDGGLRSGWQESGSAVRELNAGAPAKVRFNDSGESILARPGLTGRYGGVLFRVREPDGEGEFLALRLGAAEGHPFPTVKLKPDHRMDVGDGWSQVRVPMTELNPEGAPFDRVVFAPFRPFGGEWVSFDKIALARVSVDAPSPSPAAAAVTGGAARARLSCDAQATRISPLIYGVSAGGDDWSKSGTTVRRWGGNPATRYNWETQFSNGAKDWFFENRPGGSYSDFLADDASHGVETALTIPILGWVAKDGTSYSFPVSAYGAQARRTPGERTRGTE